MTAPPYRWFRLCLALITGATLLVVPATAQAQPDGPDEDGKNAPLLRDVLSATGRNFAKAKAAADESKKRQLQLNLRVQAAQRRLDELRPQVGSLAAESYRTGRIGPTSLLLSSSTPDSFLDRAVKLNELNMVNDSKLRDLNAAIADLNRSKAALDAEVQQEQNQLKIMAQQKNQAQKALNLVGGASLTSGGLVSAESPVARKAPRNPDGSFPEQGCTQDDPTTGGCVTPRTLHAYKEAKRAGFDRFVGCFRSGGPFEHPKGRACDWSLRYNGFSPAATQDQKLYGNNLAAFLVRNADRLGVLYVIWNRQIWFPATGWASYSGPSDHTDHVHMSML